jgi:hypothetical protein
MKQLLYFSGLFTTVIASFASSIFNHGIPKNGATKFTEDAVFKVVTNIKLFPAL